MANTPISGFASGAPAQAGDEFVIARSGANFKLTTANLATYIGANGAAGTNGQIQYNNSGAFGGLSQLTFSGGKINVVSAPFGLSGNISAAAWTTSGIRYANVAATLTDTSSTGTVATAYTDLFGGNTIAASSATTFTNYYTSWFNAPTAGTNVTFTGRWAMGLGGSLDIQAGTVTTNTTPALNLSQTWNDGTVTFTGLKFNVTNTASANASKLFDFQVGGTSRFEAQVGNAVVRATGYYYDTTAGYYISDGASGSWSLGNFRLINLAQIAWVNSLNANSGTADLFLTRANTATLQLGAADAAAPVAQTLLIQSGSGTDINGVAFNIGGSKSTGTGTAGLVNIQTSSRGAASGTSQNVLATVASFGPNTLSGSQAISLLDMAQTWNTSGAPTAIKLNVTNTLSPTNSFLISLQNSGTNQFAVRADNGACFIGTPTSDLNNYTLLTISNDFYINSKSVTAGGVRLCSGTYAWAYLKSVGVSGARFQLGNATPFGWTDNAEGSAGTFDTILTRDAANTLALRNGGTSGTPVPQTFRVYNWGDASNGEYIETFFTSNVAYVRPNKNGTGAVRDFQIGSSSSSTIIYGGNSSSYLLLSVNGCTLSSVASLSLNADYGNNKLTLSSAGVTVTDAVNIIVGTTTGTKIGTATSQKIGFWNATPIVQPTTGVAEAAFVENSGGTAVNVDSTFGGYTLQQVVQALQNAGLLA